MSSALPFFNSRSSIRELIAVIATYYAGCYAASSGRGTVGPGGAIPSTSGPTLGGGAGWGGAGGFKLCWSEHHLDLVLAAVVGQRDERFSREQRSVKADPGYPAADAVRVLD